MAMSTHLNKIKWQNHKNFGNTLWKHVMVKTLRVLSLGAGVQSSTLALMIHKGEIPMVDCAIFADTQAEPPKVYEWLKFIKKTVSLSKFR